MFSIDKSRNPIILHVTCQNDITQMLLLVLAVGLELNNDLEHRYKELRLSSMFLSDICLNGYLPGC